MKRISVNIFSTYLALFKDMIMWGQVDPYESERDLSRIVSLCETRGERSIFIDFPSCAKVFDYALSRGHLNVKKLAILGKPIDGLPPFMHTCFRRVFTGDGKLRHDPDVSSVMAIRQVLLLYKKVEIPCTEEVTREEVNSFFSLDRSLRSGCDHWDDLGFTRPGSSLLDGSVSGSEPVFGPEYGTENGAPPSLSRLAQRVCDQIVRRFHWFDPDSIVGNHGPGAVADLKSGMDKYVFPTWNQRLERVFPRDLHASANIRVFDYGHWYDEASQGDLRELPAKLIPVAKTQEKPRLIASEPVANQFIQGGIRKYLRHEIEVGVLSATIDIQDQSLSRDYALRATQEEYRGQIATVDLSSASDRLSLWTVERVFRMAPRLLSALAASRSQYIVDTKYTQQYARLRKYAPQGNATVFPLQSIVYACLAIASVIWSVPGTKVRSDADLWAAIKTVAPGVRVFGDDIIIDTRALPALSSLLEHCQLKVNGAKSHYSGTFAESCGMDAFMGMDVTPIYMHSVDDEISPGDVQSIVDVSNACYRAGLCHLGNQIMGRVPEKIADQLVKTRIPGLTTSLWTYSSGFDAKRVRFNRALHREEYYTLVVADKTDHEQRDSWESLLQYFTERRFKRSHWVEIPWRSGFSKRVRTRLVRKWVPVLR